MPISRRVTRKEAPRGKQGELNIETIFRNKVSNYGSRISKRDIPDIKAKFNLLLLNRLRGKIPENKIKLIWEDPKKLTPIEVNIIKKTAVTIFQYIIGRMEEKETKQQLLENLGKEPLHRKSRIPEEEFIKNANKELIVEEIQRRPEKQIEILSRYYFLEMGQTEIAEELGVSKQRVDQVIRKFRDKFRTKHKKHLQK